MLSGKRVLVVEGEFLVALDMQRILEDSHAAATVFARSTSEAVTLVNRFAEFDLAIVELLPTTSPSLSLIRDIAAAGVAVVATSADSMSSRTVPGFSHVPFVRKPFDETELLSACAAALALRPEQP